MRYGSVTVLLLAVAEAVDDDENGGGRRRKGEARCDDEECGEEAAQHGRAPVSVSGVWSGCATVRTTREPVPYAVPPLRFQRPV
ncbi:hypothetical protein GCM10010271_64830 [Streptomyces kurssanovii]|nr:hypothetical protein GCM10010271_64830 [Streptomyces kurssanovii]